MRLTSSLKCFPCLPTLAVVFLLAGCAAHRLPPTTTASAKIIGVISGLGDEVHFARSGITVFGNAVSSGAVSNWHLDDLVLEASEKAISSKYEVITRKVEPSTSQGISGELNPILEGNIADAFRKLMQNEPRHADLWVVVAEKCANPGSYTGPVPCGIAISRPESLFSQPGAWVVVQASMTVFDGTTLKPIAQSDVILNQEPCSPFSGDAIARMGEPGCEPGRYLGHELAVDSWQSYTAAQQQIIYQNLMQILQPSIHFTLNRLNLAN